MDNRSEPSARSRTRGGPWRAGLQWVGTRLRRRPEPAPFDFDELARDLAQGLSRREALRRLGVGLGTAALAATGVIPAWAAKPGGSGGGPGCPAGQVKCKGKCVNTQTDAGNCGACGTVCPAGQTCSNGHCCPAGQTYCGGACMNLSADVNNCGACGHICPGGNPNGSPICQNGTCGFTCYSPYYITCGSSSCVNVLTDASNCGACGHVCPPVANGLPQCFQGRCIPFCYTGFTSCGGYDCNIDLSKDPNNCGTCGNVCSVLNGTAACVGGTCTFVSCNPGYTYANGSCCPTGQLNCGKGCVDVTADPKNCGACGNGCQPVANSTSVCSGGTCGYVCDSGYADCDGDPANGCETSLSTDPNNCGACGNVCPTPTTPNTVAACNSGACGVACSSGWADCDGDPSTGCETNIRADLSNCGACGNICPTYNVPNATNVCLDGVCTYVCNPGCGRCNQADICYDFSSDINNCGGCGNACTGIGVFCINGACTSVIG